MCMCVRAGLRGVFVCVCVCVAAAMIMMTHDECDGPVGCWCFMCWCGLLVCVMCDV
jgi:hypothetical protein